jgi:hypothetical protein
MGERWGGRPLELLTSHLVLFPSLFLQVPLRLLTNSLRSLPHSFMFIIAVPVHNDLAKPIFSTFPSLQPPFLRTTST